MDCNTGWFDAETDGLFDSNLDAQDASSSLLTDSFAEQILRIDNAGPMAVIAPTRISYNNRAADLMKGIANVFWPGIVIVAYPEEVVLPLYNLGIALYLGKYYVENSIVDDIYDTAYHKGTTTNLIYHLFGDPETPLWTGSPAPMEVSNPEYLCYEDTFPVRVEVTDRLGNVLEDATVCLYKEGEIHQVLQTDSNGIADFIIDPSSCGELQITVTKQGFAPYISEIEICDIRCLIGPILPPLLIIVVVILFYFFKKKKN